MGRIHRLDLFIANRIAAGEVVERPASAVKELVENAIDAGSSAISVEIKNGGIDLITVTDNGSGIPREDARLAFERHATSKISGQKDLDSIGTLGFRGEALCSIAAVSQVEMQSRVPGENDGVLVRIHGGDLLEESSFGCPPGTSFRIENLFYNTPARLRFLKKPAFEGAAIGNIIARYIMACPQISFKFTQEGKLIYHSPGDGDLLTAIYCVYGKDTVQSLLSIEEKDEENSLAIRGYISRPESARPNRNAQSFFVNGRFVQSPVLSRALQGAYGHRLMIGKFPLAVLYIELPFEGVDVNIHPNKLEIRFKQEDALADLLRKASKTALDGARIVDWQYIQPQEENKKPTVRSSVQSWQPGSYFSGEKDGQDDEQQPREMIDDKSGRIAEKAAADAVEKVAIFPTQREEKKDIPAIDDSMLREVRLDEGPEWKEILSVRESTDTLLQEPLFVQGEPAPEFTVVGQLFLTYILAESGGALYLIDQHAAHERIIYDQMLAGVEFGASQRLILPYEMVLDGEESALVEEALPLLTDMGFAFRWEEENLLQVTALPQLFEEGETGDFLREVMEALLQNSADMADVLKRDKLAQYACKHAIRGQDILTEEQMRSLIQRFGELGELNCPHGRPILIRVTRKELDKLFGRIL